LCPELQKFLKKFPG